MQALDVDAVQKMLTALETWPDHRLRAIALIATFTGLRRGELLGLRWQDVDLERGTLTVAQAAQYVKGEGVVFRQSKTHKSRLEAARTLDGQADDRHLYARARGHGHGGSRVVRRPLRGEE